MNTEGGRISHLIQKAKNCAIQEQLSKAQNYYGFNSCGTCVKINLNTTDVPSESSYLDSQIAKNTSCSFNYFKPPVLPESVRIARIQQEVIDKSTDPLNAIARFSQYSRVIIPPCPPTDPNIFNGSMPKPAKICPALPNTPLNPVLPA